ncbi:hypothetical protein Hanom_Chr15g01401011 [Helianthus anomalus]
MMAGSVGRMVMKMGMFRYNSDEDYKQYGCPMIVVQCRKPGDDD